VTYKFNFAAGEQAVQQFESISARIGQMLADQATQVAAYTAGWESDTKNAYEEARRQWEAAAAKMPQDLQIARVKLAEIAQLIGDQEVRGTSTWA
jgi:WXG100 family type VII secretion target